MIVFVQTVNPFICAEFEQAADAIVLDFSVQTSALMDIVSGDVAPSGLLPFIMPKDMETVEKHCEDLPFDIEPYTDECGNTYDFAYGLDFNGVIKDGRVAKYGRQRE